MEEKKQLVVPEGWHEVTIDQFQEISSLVSEGYDRTIDVLSILLNEDPELIKILDISVLTKLISLLEWSNELPSDANYKPVLRFDEEEYGLISRMQSLTVGEWIDLEHYLTDGSIKNLHIIMSILYRPLISAFNDSDRLIEDYDSDKMISQSLKFKNKVMITDVYGTLVFFYLIASEYTKIIQDYLTEQDQMTMMKSEEKVKKKSWSVSNWKKKIMQKLTNGTGTNISTVLQKETIQKLNK